MDRDGALRAVGVLVPHQLVDLRGRKDAVRVAHQQVEDVVLYGRELHRLAVHGDGFLGVVELHAADGDGVLRLLALLLAAQARIAPQLAPHAGLHLDGVEGLCHVVVRAHVESEHLVGALALGREQYDGYVVLLPQLGCRRDAVHFRHHDVHEHKVDVVLLHAVERLLACERGVYLVILVRQVDLQRRHDVDVVIAYQYVSHILTSRHYCTPRAI